MEKKEFPEEGELLLCTVTKIFGHSVFVNIEDFSKSGMIHISEISPGRIRNLRDYVVEGKKIVCTVLKIDKIKGHIDLSLRRVTEGQRRKKLESIKQEQKSKKIIESVAKEILPEIAKIKEQAAKFEAEAAENKDIYGKVETPAEETPAPKEEATKEEPKEDTK